MKTGFFAALAAICFTAPALASNIVGNGALSLAALVGEASPALGKAEKSLLGEYLNGRAPKSAVGKFSVKAEEVTCRISDVDITEHVCAVTIGGKKIGVYGRRAHEIYATLVENGVPSDGAAGTLYESLIKLNCAIDPAAVAAKGGGGVSCDFSTAK